jgi:hypothetical protein
VRLLLRPEVHPHAVRNGRLPVAVVGSVAVVVAGSVAQLVNHAFDLGIGALDSAEDGGAFGLVGDLAAVSAATAAWSVVIRVRPVRPTVVVLAPLLTFVTLDKILRLHDDVPHYLFLYVPVLAVVFVCLVDLARSMPGPAGRLVAAGLLLLVASFGLHVVGERVLLELGLEHVGWARQVKAVVKHGCEVQGWFLVAIGLGSGLLRNRRAPRGRHASNGGVRSPK